MKTLNKVYKWIRAVVITVEVLRRHYDPLRESGLSKLNAFSKACELMKEEGEGAKYFHIEVSR